MRTVRFKVLLDAVGAGLDLDTADVTTTMRAKHVEALNQAMRFAWTWARWPELGAVQQVTPTAGLVAWADLTGTLGTPWGVTKDDPDTTRQPRPVQWRFNSLGHGLQVMDGSSPVFVQFCKVTPEWSGTAYNVATAYVEGDVVYDATTGDGYEAVQASTGQAVTNTAYWRKLEVPMIFRRPVVRGALALLNGSTGKRSEEQILEGSMGELLAQELDQFRAAAGQTQTMAGVPAH
jgi:hypothetical protein